MFICRNLIALNHVSIVFNIYQSTNEILIRFLLSQTAQHFSAKENPLKTIEPERGNCLFIETELNVRGKDLVGKRSMKKCSLWQNVTSALMLKTYLLNRLILEFTRHGVGMCLTEPSLILFPCQMLVLSGEPPSGDAAALHRSQL